MIRRLSKVLRYTQKALSLVWSTDRGLALVLLVLTVITGAIAGPIAYMSKLIVDAVVLASQSGLAGDRWLALSWIAVEGVLIASREASSRGLSFGKTLLRALLEQRVNLMILEKAQGMQLSQFEDPDFYDKLTYARNGAATRPLGLVLGALQFLRTGVTLLTYGWLLVQFSWLAVLALVVAAIPSFVAEAHFSGAAFNLFRRQVPESRRRSYLERILSRNDFAKELKLLGAGPLFLARYREIFERLYVQTRKLIAKRNIWVFSLSLLSTIAFYGAYAFIGWSAATGEITLGAMAMYLGIFRQGQTAITTSLNSIGTIYEESLYLSNLYEFLEDPKEMPDGTATAGKKPGDGLRVEGLSFTYPEREVPALSDVNLHLEPGQTLALVGGNGSGKTTLIKLLTRLYEPSEGRILLDGTDLKDWKWDALRQRFGSILQEFVRYQLEAGENIGLGDVRNYQSRDRQKIAAGKGMASSFIEEMPNGYATLLGRLFKGGLDLSGGQWQKIALSRGFMKENFDILVLDEPTSALDAEAEAHFFDLFRNLSEGRMVILASHRLSAVRDADQIAVLSKGHIIERGSHDALLERNGQYAYLFELQGKGYQL